MGFSGQEYWSGLPCPPPGGLPDPGIKPGSPAFQVDSLLEQVIGSPLVSDSPSSWCQRMQEVSLRLSSQLLLPRSSVTGITWNAFPRPRGSPHPRVLELSGTTVKAIPVEALLSGGLPGALVRSVSLFITLQMALK